MTTDKEILDRDDAHVSDETIINRDDRWMDDDDVLNINFDEWSKSKK